MLRAKRILILPLLAALWGAVPAAAQSGNLSGNPLCEFHPETIVTARPHNFGEPGVWDAKHHPLGTVIQFGAGMPTANGTVMAFGRRLEPGTAKPLETVMVELNPRGRAAALTTRPAKTDEAPFAIMPGANDKGYIVASNIRNGKRAQLRLAWHDDAAAFQREKMFADDVFDYTGARLIPAPDGRGMMALLNAVNHRNDSDRHAVLLRLSYDGEVMWRRAYRPGAANWLHDITPLPEGGFFAVGSMVGDDGRDGGWAMKLAHDGAITWQRTYPRGAGAALKHAAVMPHDTPGRGMLVALGDALGVDGAPVAAWVMVTDPGGAPLWQRYIRRPDFDLRVLGVMPESEGRLGIALNAVAVDDPDADMSQRRSHVRLLTLSPHGYIVQDEAYIDGIEARGAQFSRGANGERVIVGTIISDARTLSPSAQLRAAIEGPQAEENPENEEKPPATEQAGWVFVAMPLDPYDDPCLPKTRAQETRSRARLND